jgi:hypothetical protein
LIGVVAGWASCAITAEEANTQADRDKTDTVKGKIFTTKLPE